jgi:hypothetical protein
MKVGKKLSPKRASQSQISGRFSVRLVAVFLRPGLIVESAPRRAKVKACRRQPPEAARSGFDDSEHGRQVG